MPSRRKLKKEIKRQTDLLIEDAYYQTLDANDKEADKMEKVVDDVVDSRYDLLSRISSYPNRENRTKVKEHFNAIKTDLSARTKDFGSKIGRIA